MPVPNFHSCFLLFISIGAVLSKTYANLIVGMNQGAHLLYFF